ncbi:MAG: HAD family phosphatase [Chlamydiales bacterium]
MDWVEKYDLFLFDFDGLLVDTEKLHYEAYRKMCLNRGISFNWDFETYCIHAHFEADGIKKGIYKAFPKLHKQEGNWDVLYQEKKSIYQELLLEKKIHLMPSAAELLNVLHEKSINRCVVTHSVKQHIDKIVGDNPILQTIPHWITREDYSHPKPHPECYQKAIQLYGKLGDRIIGFEDTPRGLLALMGTRATPVIVTKIRYTSLMSYIDQGVKLFESLADIQAI